MVEKGVSVLVVVILSVLLCIIVGIGAWKYGEFSSEKKILEQQENPKYEIISVDRTLANEQIDSLRYVLAYVVEDYNDIFKDRINNGEFIKNKREEFKYVWMYSIMFNKEIVKFNVDHNGKEVTGMTSISVDDFIVSYKEALGVNFVFAENTLPEGFTYNQGDNRIYGVIPSNWQIGGIIFKFNNLVKQELLYTLTIDVIKIDYDEEGIDQDELDERLETFQDISDYENVDYDSSYVDHKLKLIFVNEKGKYAVKSIVASE